ncbi:MAG: helix-turn-helix domain-containing protein, partial [Gammaproteobacteria bacterium]
MHDRESTAPAVSGFGGRLRQAREAHKLSIDEVAAQLNLKPTVIVALEQDRYQDLASAAFARGYLRGYARLLGLDAESFIQSNKQLAIGGCLIRPHTAQPGLKTGDSDLLFKIAGCLIVAVLGFWLV